MGLKRLSVEKSFPSRKMTTTTLCKWEETSPSPGPARSFSVTRAPTRTTDQVSARSWMRLRIRQIHKALHKLSPQIHVGKSEMMAAAQIKGCRLMQPLQPSSVRTFGEK